MIIPIILAAAALQATPHVEFVRNITLSQSDTDWAVQSHADGEVSASDQAVVVTLDKMTLTANPKYGKQQNISRYKVCLAYRKADTSWDFASCAVPIEHGAVLKSGRTETITDLTFNIPAVDTMPMESLWLVLDVEVESKQGTGEIYSHSDKNVFRRLAVASTQFER